MQRIWLDWSHPCIPAAADWLIERGRADAPQQADSICDLSAWLVVTSGRRAGQDLLAAIVQRADDDQCGVLPPRLVTPGTMVDLLIDPDAGEATKEDLKPAASEIEAQTALAQVLRSIDPTDLTPLLTSPPQQDDWLGWLGLAQRIFDLHVELTGGCRRFADVAHAAETLELFREADRWRVLDDLHARCIDLLGRARLVDAHVQRLARIEAKRIRSSQRIALVGVVELNALQRAALSAVDSDSTSEVTALVHCTADEADGFDAFGCVVPDAWQSRDLPIDMEKVTVADLPSDQAQAAVREIGRVADHRRAGEVTVGVGEPQLEPYFEHAGTWAGLRLRSAAGRSVSAFAPIRLLRAIAQWLDDPRFARFAALLRHADVEQFVSGRFQAVSVKAGSSNGDEAGASLDAGAAIETWLGMLDRYFSEHLQVDVSGTWLGEPRLHGDVKRVYEIVSDWLAPLNGPARPLRDWAEPILDVLNAIYSSELTGSAERPSDRVETLREACRCVRDHAEMLTQIDDAMMPKVTASTALNLLADRAGRARIPLPSRRGDIDMLGWLELHMDTAPVLIIAGVNDGAIPASATADAFLPDALRARLGLMCNHRRYARDAYLLEAVVRSRAHVRMIAGRRSRDGESLAPSRLLLTCRGEALAQRVLDLTDEEASHHWSLPLGASSPSETSGFVIPRPPEEGDACPSMRVTDFLAYLACPYRYWLSRIEGIDAVDDSATELDPLAFGSLAHHVLEQFGTSELRDSTDAEAIARFLRDALGRSVRDRYGRRPPPAVQVQVLRMALRFDRFAEVQAAERADGWRIEQCEYDPPEEAFLDIPGDAPVQLRAKIDRIDRHEKTGEVRVLDYKTSESTASPEYAHWHRETYNGNWVDLQLPLYHYLVRQSGETAPIDVGYIILPKNPADVAVRIASKFTADVVEAGIERARQVVRDIRAGRFEPNVDHRGHDEFDRILQVSTVGGGTDDHDDEGGAA